MIWMIKKEEMYKIEFNIFVYNQVLPLINLYPENRNLLIIDNKFTNLSQVITNLYFDK